MKTKNFCITNQAFNDKLIKMDECAICLESLNNEIVKLDCNHQFHLNCIKNIDNNKCPLCRKFITTEDICNGCVRHNYFYAGSIKKNGNCFHCNKISFSGFLKQRLI